MAYAAGDTILDDEYNVFVNSSTSPFGYNHFAGTGSTVYGWGQTHIPVAVAGEKITAAQWNLLFNGLINVANHTNVSLNATTQAIAAGESIAIRAALITDLAAQAAAIAGSSTGATALTTSSALTTSNSSSNWVTNFTVEQSVTFTNANTMRWFFNAGGKVRVVTSRTGNGGTSGGATTKDTNWTTLFAAVGNLDIGGAATTRSGSGETLSTDGLANGFHDLDDNYTVLIKLTEGTSPYTSNYIEISAKLNAAVGTAVTMTVKSDSRDGSGEATYTGGNTDGVDATPDRVGQCRVETFVLSPNDTQGLASTITKSAQAEVSNATDG